MSNLYFQAIGNNDTGTLNALVEGMVAGTSNDINGRNDDHFTPLMLAVHSTALNLVKILLTHNQIDLNASMPDSNTALHIAITNGNIQLVKMLLEDRRIDVYARNRDGNTALHIAIANGHIELVKMLLEDGRIDVNSQNILGMTPTSLAIHIRAFDIRYIQYPVPQDAPVPQDEHVWDPLTRERTAITRERVTNFETRATEVQMAPYQTGRFHDGALLFEKPIVDLNTPEDLRQKNRYTAIIALIIGHPKFQLPEVNLTFPFDRFPTEEAMGPAILSNELNRVIHRLYPRIQYGIEQEFIKQQFAQEYPFMPAEPPQWIPLTDTHLGKSAREYEEENIAGYVPPETLFGIHRAIVLQPNLYSQRHELQSALYSTVFVCLNVYVKKNLPKAYGLRLAKILFEHLAATLNSTQTYQALAADGDQLHITLGKNGEMRTAISTFFDKKGKYPMMTEVISSDSARTDTQTSRGTTPDSGARRATAGPASAGAL